MAMKKNPKKLPTMMTEDRATEEEVDLVPQEEIEDTEVKMLDQSEESQKENGASLRAATMTMSNLQIAHILSLPEAAVNK